MKIVFSHPGRHGDILWSLPSARALAEAFDTPITLVLSPKYSSLADLLRLQPYVAEVAIDPAWDVQETAPMTPRVPPTPIEADLVVHAGYDGWPTLPLPEMVELIVRRQVSQRVRPIELERPWITIQTYSYHFPYAYGFTDEWFELKVGLIHLLDRARKGPLVSSTNMPPQPVCSSPRWIAEEGCSPLAWTDAAQIVQCSSLFLGCCSALHVLAVGLGKRCVIMEPNQQRWNPIFWPLGMDGPEVTCVKGGDGLPTFDSRHTTDTLRRVLSEVSV